MLERGFSCECFFHSITDELSSAELLNRRAALESMVIFAKNEVGKKSVIFRF